MSPFVIFFEIFKIWNLKIWELKMNIWDGNWIQIKKKLANFKDVDHIDFTTLALIMSIFEVVWKFLNLNFKI
jgi:hypothetical protein